MPENAFILRGDAAYLPLPDSSVDLIVTSPPYYALRSYTDGGFHYAGQIGSEATPTDYIAALIDCTREWARVLKPTGSMFVDLGDKYSTSLHSYNYRDPGTYTRATPQPDGEWSKSGWHGKPNTQPGRQEPNAPPKSLMLLPERYRIAAVDRLGLICRAVIVWAKPNGLPESVTDRVRRSHEDWVHLTKQPRYYSAVDEIREPHTATNTGRNTAGWKAGPSGNREVGRGVLAESVRDFAISALGKLPGSVWSIPSEPLTVPPELGVDHFAAYPTEWPRRLIMGWSPPGICVACGEGRRPVAVREAINPRYLASNTRQDTHERLTIRGVSATSILRTGLQSGQSPATTITGYTCACPEPTAPTRPAIVLDPFGGTGTTALVATALGRTGISIDRSADYNRIATWRTTNPQELAKAMRVEKPAPVAEAQLTLDWET